jgi:hypothetical protein
VSPDAENADVESTGQLASATNWGTWRMFERQSLRCCAGWGSMSRCVRNPLLPWGILTTWNGGSECWGRQAWANL